MRKIAIVRRNGLGDLLCTYPLITYLKLEDPSTEITLFVDESNAPLTQYLPKVEEVVVLKKGGNKYFNLLKRGFLYRKKGFDLVISAKTSPMKLMNCFLYSLGGKRRAAYTDSHWSSCLINMSLKFDPETNRTYHQALKVLHLVAPYLSTVPKELYPKIQMPFPQGTLPKLLLSASTTRSSSRLDIGRYAALVNQLYKEEGGFDVEIVSLARDEIRARAIASELEMENKLSFSQNFETFIQKLGTCDMFFGGDGGIGHLMAAMDRHEVVLFGETRPVEWAPLGEYVKTLYDAVHVNRLPDETIYTALQEMLTDVRRNNSHHSNRINPNQPISTTA